MPVQGRSLDFIIIGAQKGGTTTLWQHLRHHPSIWMAEKKEEPFFCNPESDQPDAFDSYMDTHYGGAPEGALLGKATPHYMMGTDQADVARIAQRISIALPSVRLIALLRDPIERAVSHYRMSVRREWESRSFGEAVEDLLDPERLVAGRKQATETNSYLVQGEYGRILSIYRDHFPAEHLHVEMTENLANDPGGVLERVLAFLSLPAGYRPTRPGARYHRGGTRKLLDAESQASLFEFLEENVWPNLGTEAERVRHLFNRFMAIWNVAPGEEPPQLSAQTRARLEAHYEADAEVLAGLEFPAPWVESWATRESSSA